MIKLEDLAKSVLLKTQTVHEGVYGWDKFVYIEVRGGGSCADLSFFVENRLFEKVLFENASWAVGQRLSETKWQVVSAVVVEPCRILWSDRARFRAPLDHRGFCRWIRQGA